ncbi:hypothetical protein [Gimesia maris]|uniref:hypothetical protein n=1 Tax=Gimesia maris TaxID=122 RepID=UPI0030D9A445|tara:strand:+ start:13053 stop:14459 length:1407 start_codon:yes stop_codon:yes gene_type:complete
MNTKLLDSSPTPSEVSGRMAEMVLSEEELHHHWKKVKSRFNDMSESQRVDEFQKFWEKGFEVTELDKKTGLLYSSSPLMRVFTICHEQLVEGYLQFKGERLETQEEIAAAVQIVKRSIESTIRRFKGIVKEEGAEPGYADSKEPVSCFYGFQEGFGSDDYLIGMFFSEGGHTRAINEVVEEWGQFGVRTEPVGTERDVHTRRTSLWNLYFDRKEYRKNFAKLSHEERLKEIKDLSEKGIKFRYTDRKTNHNYNTDVIPFGMEQYSRRFSYDFMLKYSEKNLPGASARREEIDRLEKSLFGIIAKHNGFVTIIERDLIQASNACLSLQESEDFDGKGHVYVQFPSKNARSRASEEVFEKLSSYGVQFSLEKGEEPSPGEQNAILRQELDSKRARLDLSWKMLEWRKERHREESIELENAEAGLLQRERDINKIEQNLPECEKHPNHKRTNSSDRESMGTKENTEYLPAP